MATRQVLGELAQAWEQRSARPVRLESVGGVDAARRVAAGEAFDFVVLASDAIDKLVAGGQAVAGSRVDLVDSGVAIAVQAGAPRPDIASEDALRRAVLAAPNAAPTPGPARPAPGGWPWRKCPGAQSLSWPGLWSRGLRAQSEDRH